jgi:hypothetical protein
MHAGHAGKSTSLLHGVTFPLQARASNWGSLCRACTHPHAAYQPCGLPGRKTPGLHAGWRARLTIQVSTFCMLPRNLDTCSSS